MIKGFRVKVTSAELQTHLVARAAYHRGEAAKSEKELPELKATAVRLNATVPATTVSGKGYNYSNAPGTDVESAIEQLEADIKSRLGKALAFDYLSTHLFDEDYDLDESDLIRLEILKTR